MSLMACSMVRQFPMSWAPRDTTSSYSSSITFKACSTSVPSVPVISKSRASLSSSKWSIHCSLSYASWHNHPTGLSIMLICPSFSISSHSLTASSGVLSYSTKCAARCNQSVAFSDRVKVLSLSESLATVMTSISSSSLYHWTLALLEVVLMILTSNFLPCASNFNLFSVKIKSALYLENQFDPINSSSLVESTTWILIGTKASIILSWVFSTIPKVGLFWPFTVTMFVASVGLVHFRPNFIASGLVQTDICVPVSHDAWIEFLL